MIIDATFWVAVSFLIFVGLIIYLKVPQKLDNSLNENIKKIKDDLENAEKLKDEAKNILSEYESRVSKSKEEIKNLINNSRNQAEKIFLEQMRSFTKLWRTEKNLQKIKLNK